ncbi:hypothetical protein AMK59_1414 [Oryctes borbonicus]|uniref:C2H2-type domain-containing protein n=1 Tax=Oryctes borbonicus TaxID=1629725 RepID=A0A0T6BHN3_9SCAR|nr:hypothetical protein AMK59_1414 [Oryctes borbonicus]
MKMTSNQQILQKANTPNQISTYLDDCIATILKKQLLRLNIKKVSQIIAGDLNISIKDVSSNLRCTLCECLCYYMKVWPGWKEYHNNCTTDVAKNDYHNKFREYLAAKLQYIIEHKESFLPAKDVTEDKMAQTDVDMCVKGSKPEAPYQLIVAGEPCFLNNMGFIESCGNVILTQYQGRPLNHLDIRQVLNYPYIKVNVNFLDIEFSRTSCHKFIRYISESKDSIVCPETEFLYHVKKWDSTKAVQVYTLDYISAYCKQFLAVAQRVYMVDTNKLKELELVIKQFLRDVQESDVQRHLTLSGTVVNTMATNVTVCYNIGKMTYVRNKKMAYSNSQTKNKTINFCEILVPKVEYTLKKFTAVEDGDESDITFKSLWSQNAKLQRELNERNKFNDMIKGAITYECSWCSVSFVGEYAYSSIVTHFKMVHKGEQAVVCFKCRKEFGIAHLAGSRWKHDCEKRKQEKEVSSSTTQADAEDEDSGNVLNCEQNGKTQNIDVIQNSTQVSSTAEIVSPSNEHEEICNPSSDAPVDEQNRTDNALSAC